MSNKTVYIAGKVSKPAKFPSKTIWRYYVSFKFKIVEFYLIFLGYEVINPVSEVGWDVTWHEAMCICLHDLIPQSDYCYFMFDWRWSKGAKLELKYSAALKKLILNSGLVSKYYWTYYFKIHSIGKTDHMIKILIDDINAMKTL